MQWSSNITWFIFASLDRRDVIITLRNLFLNPDRDLKKISLVNVWAFCSGFLFWFWHHLRQKCVSQHLSQPIIHDSIQSLLVLLYNQVSLIYQGTAVHAGGTYCATFTVSCIRWILFCVLSTWSSLAYLIQEPKMNTQRNVQGTAVIAPFFEGRTLI